METTVRQCVARYLHFLRAIERFATAKTYGNHQRVWMRWLDGAGLTTPDGTKLNADSSMEDVNSFELIAASWAYSKSRRKMDNKPIHNNAVRSLQHAIRALWTYACDAKMWAPGPAPLSYNAAASVPMAKHADNKREEATTNHAEALLNACELRATPRSCALAYAVMQVLLTAGLRRAEMIFLEVSDYDRKLRKLHVQHAKGGIPRTQNLDDATCDALNRWIALRGNYIRGRWEQLPSLAWHHVPDASAPDFLFTLGQRRHLSDSGVTALFQNLRELAGLRKVTRDGKEKIVEYDLLITPHCLRHLQATRIYLKAGLRAAQRFCGHQKEKTTWKYIRSTTDKQMDEVLDQVQLRPPVAPVSNAPMKAKRAKTTGNLAGDQSRGSRRICLRRRLN